MSISQGRGPKDCPQRECRRLRVVHFIDSFGIGGTELNAIRTLEKLDPNVFELHLACLNQDGPLRDRYVAARVRVKTFPIPNLRGPTALRRGFDVIRWMRKIQPDVVHCHDRYTNAFATPCANLTRVPLIITSRRWWTAMPRPGYGLANRIAYRLSNVIIANSYAVERLLIEVDRVDSKKVRVIPNFVDDSGFDTLERSEILRMRKCFGVPEDAVVGTAVAKFRPEKDLISLIRATADIAPKYPRFHLLLIGEGPCDNDLKAAAQALGIAERVHFSGLLKAPPNPHQFGDFSLLSSIHEAFPNTVIEAMAAGRPVIATAVGGVAEAVEHAITGFLVPPRAPALIADAMERLIKEPELRQRLGSAGRERATAKYNATSVIDRLSTIYLANSYRAAPFNILRANGLGH